MSETLDRAGRLLAGYGATIGLPDLAFDMHGCARIEFSDALAIDLEVDAATDGIHIYHVLSLVPVGASETFFRRLLQANFFFKATRGATLSIDAKRDEVLLARHVDLATMSVEAMAAVMQEFVACATSWRERLWTGELASGGLPRDSASASPAFDHRALA